MHKNAPLSPMPFPARSPSKGTSADDDRLAACVRDEEIFGLCRETVGALQELRHGIQVALFDILDKLDLDAGVLANLIEERPSVARALIRRDTERLTTEELIPILEKLARRNLID